MSVYNKLDATDEFGGIQSFGGYRNVWWFGNIPFEFGSYGFELKARLHYDLEGYKPVNPRLEWFGIYKPPIEDKTIIGEWSRHTGELTIYKDQAIYVYGHPVAASILEKNQREVIHTAWDTIMRIWDIYESDIEVKILQAVATVRDREERLRQWR